MNAPKKGRLHAHGCRQCDLRYECNCLALKEDGLCAVCRGGRPSWLLIENRAPQDCCRALSRSATKGECTRYSLAGIRRWYICPTCKRTHPFDPRSTR